MDIVANLSETVTKSKLPIWVYAAGAGGVIAVAVLVMHGNQGAGSDTAIDGPTVDGLGLIAEQQQQRFVKEADVLAARFDTQDAGHRRSIDTLLERVNQSQASIDAELAAERARDAEFGQGINARLNEYGGVLARNDERLGQTQTQLAAFAASLGTLSAQQRAALTSVQEQLQNNRDAQNEDTRRIWGELSGLGNWITELRKKVGL